MRRDSLLWITIMIHTSFFLALLLAPLTNSNYILIMHGIFIPFILAHWISGDNTCAVTLVERGVRMAKDGKKYDDDSCISCKIIEPVFDFPKYYPKYYKYIVVGGLLLWFITIYKIYGRWTIGKINNWRDIFTI